MGALTTARIVRERSGVQFEAPAAADVTVYAGALVVLDSSGDAKPGVTAAGLWGAGICEETADNAGGSAGDINVKIKRGVFAFGNSGGADEITKAEIGKTAYVVDDQTVAKTSNAAARSPAGTVIDVDSFGVWIELGYKPPAAGALVAANNLSDLGAVATARANLGIRDATAINVADLRGAQAVVYREVMPRAGTIAKIWTALQAALATGNATITASINGVAVTTGVVTITQAGSAAGDVYSATPTAANAFVAGDVVELTVGGTNTATVGAIATLELAY